MGASVAAHDGDVELIDGPSARAKQQAATAKRGFEITVSSGLTTKIHTDVDVQGLPIRLSLSAGQSCDEYGADDLLDHVGAETIVPVDEAYDADRIRASRRDKGSTLQYPARGRPLPVIVAKYKSNAVESLSRHLPPL